MSTQTKSMRSSTPLMTSTSSDRFRGGGGQLERRLASAQGRGKNRAEAKMSHNDIMMSSK